MNEQLLKRLELLEFKLANLEAAVSPLLKGRGQGTTTVSESRAEQAAIVRMGSKVAPPMKIASGDSRGDNRR